MFQFFDALFNIIGTVVNFIVTSIQMIINMFLFIIQGFTYMLGVIGAMPDFAKAAIIATVGFSLIITIIHFGS